MPRPDLVGRAHRRLDAAGSIDALLAEVARFLDELPPGFMAETAFDCRPRRVMAQEDVLHWYQRLENQRMLGAQGTRSRRFRVVRDFFAHAAIEVQCMRPRRDQAPPVQLPRRVRPPGPTSLSLE